MMVKKFAIAVLFWRTRNKSCCPVRWRARPAKGQHCNATRQWNRVIHLHTTQPRAIALVDGAGEVDCRLASLLLADLADHILAVSRSGMVPSDRVKTLRLDYAGAGTAAGLARGAALVNPAEATPPSVAARTVGMGGRLFETLASPGHVQTITRAVAATGGSGAGIVCFAIDLFRRFSFGPMKYRWQDVDGSDDTVAFDFRKRPVSPRTIAGGHDHCGFRWISEPVLDDANKTEAGRNADRG